MAGFVIDIGLRRVSINKGPAIHRIGLAACLVLDGEEHFAAVEIDHILETILVLAAFFGDQAQLLQPPVRARKIGDVDLHVMTVVRPFGCVGFTEIEILFLADLHARLRRAGAVFDDIGGRAQHLAIKPRDARSGPGPDVEPNVRHAELNAAKTLRVGRMHVDAVAPRANRLDAIVAFAEVELAPGQRFADAREAIEERATIRHYQSSHAAQDFWRSHRQVELAHADIDPHVASARIEEWIARQSQSADVVVRRDVLIADTDIDVTEIDDIADVLRGAIVLFVLHEGVPLGRSLGRGSVATVPEANLACVCLDGFYGGMFCSSGNAA